MIKRLVQNIVAIKLPPMDKMGNIIIPECHKGKNKWIEGEVYAVGPGLVSKKTGRRVPMDVKPGDFVMIEPYRFLTAEIDGMMLAFTREPEIMAVTDGFQGNEYEKLFHHEGDLMARKDY